MTDTIEKIVFAYESADTKIQVSIAGESGLNLDDVTEKFVSFLIHCTFQENTISNCFAKYVDESDV